MHEIMVTDKHIITLDPQMCIFFKYFKNEKLNERIVNLSPKTKSQQETDNHHNDFDGIIKLEN